MEILKFIFYLCIVFILFNFIWSLFMLMMRVITGGQREGKFEEIIIKAGYYYLLTSVTAMRSLEMISLKPSVPESTFVIVGAIMVFFYLAGKLEKKKLFAQFQINNRMAMFGNTGSLFVDKVFLPISVGLYITMIFQPQIAINNLNIWLSNTISDIYTTPVIGWIVGLIGVFFMISMLFRGMHATNNLLNEIMGRKPQNNNQSKGGGFGFTSSTRHETEYTDFEIVEDDDDSDEENTDSSSKIES